MFGPSGFWTMAPLHYAAKFDPFLSLDCAPTPSTLAQSKERKRSNFAIWQPCMQIPYVGGAMVPYGENSLLYVGGKHTTDNHGSSDKIYQFDGKEMRAKVFRYPSWFRFRSPYSGQVNCSC